MDDQMEYDRQLALHQMLQQEQIRRVQHIEGKVQLQQQIMDRQKLEEEAKKAAEKDKKQIEEILRKIQEEDLREMELKQSKAQETRHIIRGYQVQREQEVEDKRRREKEVRALF